MSCPFADKAAAVAPRLPGGRRRVAGRRGTAARPRARRRAGRPRRRAAKPFWGAAPGRHRDAAADAHLLRRLRPRRQEARRGGRRCCGSGPTPRARMTAGETARPLGDDLASPRPDSGDGAGPCAGAADPHLRLRRRAVHQGRRRPLRPRRAGGRRRWSTCRSSTATSCSRRAPAATSRCRPAPTIRRSRSMPCASSRGWPMASAQMRWAQAGFCPTRRRGETPRNLMGFKDGTNNPPLGATPTPRRPRASTMSSGSATRARLDARRQLYGGAAHPHCARALGSHRGRFPGADDRPAQIFRARRSARRTSTIRSTSTASTRTAIR